MRKFRADTASIKVRRPVMDLAFGKRMLTFSPQEPGFHCPMVVFLQNVMGCLINSDHFSILFPAT